MLNYTRLLSAASKSSSTRPLVIQFRKGYLPVLRRLSEIGIILSFNIVGKYLVIKGRGTYKINYKNLFLNSTNVKSLKCFQYREGGVAAYVMHTDRGLCLGTSAINQHIGGKLIMKFI
jgi:hypothetical protein